MEPVTLLKPLKGIDNDLKANLKSCFLQDHPKFELIFSVADPDDPAVDLVTDLLSDFPHVDAKLMIGIDFFDRETSLQLN